TPNGRSQLKNVKQQIHNICEEKPGRSMDREALLPETLEVLKLWEALPMAAGTRQWAFARVRQLGFLLVHGLFQESQLKGRKVTPRKIAEAQCWLHRKPDGSVSMFQPIRQPWLHKDLLWEPGPDDGVTEGSFTTITDAFYGQSSIEYFTAENDRNNPEALRISTLTLQQLMNRPIQSEETTTAHARTGEVAAIPQMLHETAEQAHHAANKQGHHPGKRVRGYGNRATVRTVPDNSEIDSDEPVITTMSTIGRAGATPKQETPEAENDTVHGMFTTIQPVLPRDQRTDLYRFANISYGGARSAEVGSMSDLSGGTSARVQELRSNPQNVQQINDESEALLEVSEDEEDHFNKRVKMEDIPWGWDSKYHPRFHQHVEAQSEGHSSDLQVIEQTTDDNNGDVQEVGQSRTTVQSLPSSPFGGVGVQDKEDQMLDTELKTKEEAIAFFTSQHDPNPKRSAAQLFGTNRWTSPERDVDETAKSEATTDILSRDDTEMVGFGDGLHDEQDKENCPVSGTENGLRGDEDDRLEVRIVQDMYATSEDELSANTNNTVVDY
ncbi:MAG: hypothetical protein Q9198_004221, partial [Flavoplaca austrocitrina]